MKMRLGNRQYESTFRWVKFLFASALFMTFITPSWALAQSTDDSWTEPLNLSHSGVATSPAIVSDSEGVVHVIWQDDLANFVYARFDGDQWSPPKTTNLDDLFALPSPSQAASLSQVAIHTGPNPLFIAAPARYVFAFWLSPQGRLWISRVRNQDFERVGAWDSVSLITPGVASFAAAVDARGEWHLAYFYTAEGLGHPSGIYYTRSKSNGRYWTAPALLYESAYFRGLDEGEANLSLVTAGTEDLPRVYVAWDNRPRKQVFLAQSADGGKSWEKPALVAGPAPEIGSTGPFNIQVGANQKSVVLVWQSGTPGGTCSQIYESSSDAGATWSDPQPLIEDLLGCTQTGEFVTGLENDPEGPLYFLPETKSRVFLTAWNGLHWSQPQAQPVLSGFDEPEIYTEVVYGCHRASLSGERLYIIGCDQGEGGDIWVTSRDVGPNTFSFEPPVWSQVSPISTDNVAMESVDLATTDDGLIHAFFGQHHDPAIYYTYWDGDLWSRISPVLELPEGEAGAPAIAAGPENELFLIAPNNRGALYFSRATSGDAATESRWSTPTRLEIDHDAEIGSVDIAWDAAGMVYVTYSVPVNEQRGIYLVHSNDHGTSWSEPLQVFDGVAGGFDLVGAPSLLISENGSLHIIWKEQSIREDGVPQPLSLYYSRSDDGGRSFTDPEPVVKEPVAWREILMDGEGNLHLLWQPQDTMTTVWDQLSLDGGQTWEYPQGLPNAGRLTAVTSDPAGRLHLVGLGPGALGHWLWNGSQWKSEVPPVWPSSTQQDTSVGLLAATVNKQGNMMVVLADSTVEGDMAERTLLYSTRALKLPQHTEIQEVPAQALLSPTLTAATPASELPSTPASAVDSEPINSQGQTDRSETKDPISLFAVALLPVALLLLGVLGLVIRQAARTKGR